MRFVNPLVIFTFSILNYRQLICMTILKTLFIIINIAIFFRVLSSLCGLKGAVSN